MVRKIMESSTAGSAIEVSSSVSYVSLAFFSLFVCVVDFVLVDDPDEESALDWRWLEKEVEAELAAAEQKQTNKTKNKTNKETKNKKQNDRHTTIMAPQPTHISIEGDDDDDGDGDSNLDDDILMVDDYGDPLVPPDVYDSSLAAVHADADARFGPAASDGASDANLLYQVLDEVDLDLWTKLMAGIERARDEVARTRRDEAIRETPLGQALQEQDRVRQHAPVRVNMQPPITMGGPNTLRPTTGGWMDRERTEPTATSRAPLRSVSFHGDDSSLDFGSIGHTGASVSGVGGSSSWSASVSSSSGSIGTGTGRPSPFSTDPRDVARESQLRPDASSGTYTQLVQSRPSSGGTATVSVESRQSTNRTLLHQPLPSNAREPYEKWIRGELHHALGIDRDHDTTITGRSLAAAAHAPQTFTRQMHI